MTDILTDLTLPALAIAAQASLHAFFRFLGRSPRVEFREEPGLVRWHTAVPHTWFNGVLCGRAPLASETETVPAAVRYFQSRQVASFAWWLSPGLSATDWASHLRPHGFQADSSTPGMALALRDLTSIQPAPAALQIRPVEDLDTLRVWTQTFVMGYGMPPAWTEAIYELFASLGLGWPLRHYLGYWQGQPVATSTLFLGAGVAGVYDVATLPAARGQGLGALLTRAPLLEADALGYRAGVLQSSGLGFNVYRRLGFTKVCDLNYFVWRAEREP
jgi:GNAT superfamily N-acetyltransferase